MAIKTFADVAFVRSLNQRIVLDTIFHEKTTSRTDLANTLSMSKPAISDNLTPLIKLGLVEEVGAGDAKKSVGRKPIVLSFNKSHRYIIAIDLNYTNPVFVLADLNGEIVREFDIRISKSTPDGAYLTIIEDGINLILTSSGIPHDKLLCIAVASPGVFDSEGQLLSYNPQFSGIPWCSIDFRQVLYEKFKVHVVIMNDINAAALGEWIHRERKSDESMLFISCGNGLGSGLVLDGKLYEGKRFNAGEIYCYTDTERLRQNRKLEDMVNSNALIGRCRNHIDEGGDTMLKKYGDTLDFGSVVDAFRQKDRFVCNLVSEICNELSVLALNFAGLLSPDAIVFGGDYIVFGDVFLESCEKNAKLFHVDMNRIQLAAQGRYSGIHGLVSRVRDRYFDRICNTGSKAAL